MASSFPITWAVGQRQPVVRNYPVYSGETFSAGDLVYYDTSGVRLCGADPALILGIAMTGSADASSLHPQSLIPVAVLTADVLCVFSSATTPTLAAMLTAYGLVRTSAGLWRIDTSDTSNTRIDTVDYTPKSGVYGQEAWLARFKAANLQGDAVAS